MTEKRKPIDGAHDVFNRIVTAKNTAQLEKALADVDTFAKKIKGLLIDSLEQYTIDELLVDKNDMWIAENIMVLLGGLSSLVDAFTDDDDLFEFHRILLMSDKVVTAKGTETHPLLKNVLDAASKLSDTDYNKMSKLAKIFTAACKNVKNPPKTTIKKNPHRKPPKP